jgi:hypothetical protein
MDTTTLEDCDIPTDAERGPGQVLATRQEELRPPLPAPSNPMDMLARAIERGVAPETLDKLMALQERFEASQARKAFDAAVADAKAEIPVVGKNAVGHNNKRYANFAAYAAAVDPIISRHGLSYRFRTKQENNQIHVTCVLSHRAGHSEENTLSGPADTTGSKNAIQSIGSTLTYLQRYTLIQALGLAAAEDDDGMAAGGTAQEEAGPISEEQVKAIWKLLEETKTEADRFCTFFKIQAIPDLPAASFQKAVNALEAKRRKTA